VLDDIADLRAAAADAGKVRLSEGGKMQDVADAAQILALWTRARTLRARALDQVGETEKAEAIRKTLDDGD
jgi:hypothetical protein